MSRKTSFDVGGKNHSKTKWKACKKASSFHVPHKDELLAKVSHVNDAMLELNSEIYDHKDKEECHFLRILRVGGAVKDKSSIIPGKLVIVHKSSGHHLEQISRKFGEEYWLIRENDILAVLDL